MYYDATDFTYLPRPIALSCAVFYNECTGVLRFPSLSTNNRVVDPEYFVSIVELVSQSPREALSTPMITWRKADRYAHSQMNIDFLIYDYRSWEAMCVERQVRLSKN